MKILNIVSRAIVLAGVWHAAVLSAAAAEGGAAGAGAPNPLIIDPDLAWFTLVVFVVLLLVLTKFAWKPLLAGLDRRERTIAQMIDEAKRNHDAAAEQLQAYEQKLASATVEAQNVLAQARRDATAAGEQLINAAREQAHRERQRALDDITVAKNAAVQELADQSAKLAFMLARKLIHKELKPEDHTALIRESLDQFPSEN
ncbi:MAG: F0F1 ATP synthase subunit B [Planctomycetaceae bacterium]|nr:F0F1 ATP synthase subunit B [Planctomycetaceae bacterium]